MGNRAILLRVILHFYPLLIRRLTFIQHIYVIADGTRPQVRAILSSESAVTSYRNIDGKLYIDAIPHFALFEFVEVIRTKSEIHDSTTSAIAYFAGWIARSA